MTHRGPFQPLPFCDSVILYLKKKQCFSVKVDEVCSVLRVVMQVCLEVLV